MLPDPFDQFLLVRVRHPVLGQLETTMLSFLRAYPAAPVSVSETPWSRALKNKGNGRSPPPPDY